MPKSIKDILSNADSLSQRLKQYEPDPKDERDVKIFKSLQQAVIEKSLVEENLLKIIKKARKNGYSWSLIGSFLGTSGEAARQKYSNSKS
jgi:hypothetical protein